MNRLTVILLVLLAVSLVESGFLWYKLTTLEKSSAATEATLKGAFEDLTATTTARITELEGVLTDTQTLLQNTVDEKDNLAMSLEDEKNKNDAFENQIKKIGSTVGTLDKLSKTDPELLEKYSKVFFLNENYIPQKLVEIQKKSLYDESVPKFILSQIVPFFDNMVSDALDDGIKLWVVSAFRSFDEQKDLKGAYTVTYGSGANAFSADQGYSEHQLGTALDLTTENLNGGLDGFGSTPAYTWLQKNAYKYGYVLSYPENNTYYVFEPWHWRFVGVKLATYLHRNGKYFYDLDQRTLDTYLISIFD